jgi:hypothetical protein
MRSRQRVMHNNVCCSNTCTVLNRCFYVNFAVILLNPIYGRDRRQRQRRPSRPREGRKGFQTDPEA